VSCDEDLLLRMNELSYITEKRRDPRRELEVEVTVRTENDLLPGRTLDISESGISAILPVELHQGEELELQIKLPGNTLITRAVVRDRNVFRHGFEFVQPLHRIIGSDALVGDPGPHHQLAG